MSTPDNVPVITYTPLEPVATRKVSASEPLQWLAAGWRSFMSLKTPALIFGAVFASIGAAISFASVNNPQMMFAFWSGFLLIAPILAMVTYRMAQRADTKESVSLYSCGRLLKDNIGNTFLLVALLSVIMIAWIRLSTLTAAIYSGGQSVNIGLGAELFSAENLGLFATLGIVTIAFSLAIFALLAWAMPMLSQGRHSLAKAVVSSVSVTLRQPVPMLVWGALVAGLTIASMATFFIAFVVVFPWLGFATWEGYKRLFEE